MINVLSYMVTDQVWALSNHLFMPPNAQSPNGQPQYCWLDGFNHRIWYVKGDSGMPWDMNTYDDTYVYQSITEQSWSDPKQFKMFASKSWPGANGGIVWTMRDGNATVPPLVTADSSYRIYSDCTNFTTQTLGGQVMTELNDVRNHNFGGDLGVLESALQLQYFWGSNMEVNYYAKPYGWVQWELWKLQGGVYVQTQVSAFNKIAAGGLKQLTFPCGVPIIT